MKKEAAAAIGGGRRCHAGNITITGYSGSDQSVTVPHVLAGKTVTAIGRSAFENNETVTFYAWGPGEPSRFDAGDNVAEDYLLLWRLNGAWVYNDSRNDPVHDYPGMYSGQIGYVCEFDS